MIRCLYFSLVFSQVDTDGNGFITESELGEALKTCGISLPAYKVRDIISEFDRNNDGNISLEEFKSVGKLPNILRSENYAFTMIFPLL